MPVARKVLLSFALAPLAPICLLSSWLLWGFSTALLHTAIFASPARSRSSNPSCCASGKSLSPALTHLSKATPPLIFVAYLFGFVLFTGYLPELELWSLADPWRAALFIPLVAVILLSIHLYRKQMLEMDKQLIFEESSASTF